MIVTESLRKVYVAGWIRRRSIKALKGLDLSVAKGEIFGLLGPNGAGKTTTVKLICGLLRPTSGRIFLDGHQVSAHSRWPSRLIGAVLEGNRNVYWNLTPWQNLMYFARLRGVRERTAKTRAEELLKEFDLGKKARDVVGTLSRGMQQKLALCCALVSNPPILLVDEPTLGLDIASARAIRAKLQTLAKEENRAILLTTHNMQLAASVCDRVGIISEGELVRIGRVHDLVDVFETSVYVVECSALLRSATADRLLRIPGLRLSCEDDLCEIRLPMSATGSKNADLYEVIDILKDAHLQLLSVHEARLSLEDVFVRLTEEGRDAIPG